MIRVEYLPLETLRKHPRNSKEHDLPLLRESVERFGFNDPLALDERTGSLLEGHGRLDTLAEMKHSGASAPPRVDSRDDDWYVPVVHGVSFESDVEAEAYMIAHNRITERGGWFDNQLHEVLADIRDQTEGGLVGVGYDATMLDALARDLSKDSFLELNPDAMETDFKCPRCGHDWNGKPK